MRNRCVSTVLGARSGADGDIGRERHEPAGAVLASGRVGDAVGGWLGKPKRVAGMMPDAALVGLAAASAHPGKFADWLADPKNVDIVEFAREMGFMDQGATR